MRRSVLFILLLGLPLPAVAGATSVLAHYTGAALGGKLASAVAWGQANFAAEREAPHPTFGRAAVNSRLPLLSAPSTSRDANSALPEAAVAAKQVSFAAVRRVTPQRSLRVPADAVLRIANSGVRPTGWPVPARGMRPAGVALSGVGALGIGLRDGDILTSAAGRPARTPADVIGAVVASRGARVPLIGGRFWRNGQPWQLVVEQPYLQRRRRHASAKRRSRRRRARATRSPQAARTAPAAQKKHGSQG